MMISFRIIVFMILAVAVIPPSINPRKLDETTPTTTNHVGSLKDIENKCETCPCGTNCYTSPPPPKPSPPPPSPPPPPKTPSPTPGVNCPPPPSGGGGGGTGSGQAPPDVYTPPPIGGGGGGIGSGQAPPDNVYIPGSPKDVYPVVVSLSADRRSFAVAPELLWLSGLLLAGYIC